MNRDVSRLAYRLILRLHPASFRDEFGSEMLWIFDHFEQEQEQQPGAAAHLFLDGTLSLLRQRFTSQSDSGQLSIASGVMITGPGIGPLRFFQAALALSLLCFGLMLLKLPNPLNASVRWADRMPCYTVTLQAPSHAEVVLQTTP
jgi:hypothetical protein